MKLLLATVSNLRTAAIGMCKHTKELTAGDASIRDVVGYIFANLTQ